MCILPSFFRASAFRLEAEDRQHAAINALNQTAGHHVVPAHRRSEAVTVPPVETLCLGTNITPESIEIASAMNVLI